MKKGLLRLAALLSLFCLLVGTLTSCASREKEPYTLLIYLCGSDLESGKGYASQNIAEMLKADIRDNVRIVLQTGGTKKWMDYGIPADSLNRYVIQEGQLQHLETLEQASMGDPATLENFIRWGAEKYPAQRMGLVFWNHGGGSLAGISFDENFQYDGLTLPELDAALSASQEALPGKWDFIGFDACLMANYETVSVVSAYADTMVASEENEPAGGWDYRVLAENLGGEDFYTALLTSYAEKCRESDKETFTLSVLDLNQFQQVQQSFAAFISSLDGMDLTAVAKAAAGSLSFGSNSDGSYTNLIDLGRFAQLLGNTELPEAIRGFASSQNGIYRENASGLSFFYPLRDMNRVAEYLPLADQPYRSFLEKYYSVTDQDWITVTGAEEKDGLLHVTVSPESVAHIVKATYHLLRIEIQGEQEHVFGMGEDTDVLFDGEKGYTVNFKGNWITFGGRYLHVDIGEDTAGYTTFTAPVKVNGTASEVRFVYDKTARRVKIQGYVPRGEAAGRVTDFLQGDRITLLYDDRSEYTENLKEGESFLYAADTALEIAPLPVGYYQYTAQFYDVYGKEFQAGTAVTYFDGESMKIVAVTQDNVDVG